MTGEGRAQLRLGLCCQFAEEPIKFRRTTAAANLRLTGHERLLKLSELCRANAEALQASLEYCASHGIGAFRILSQILPIKTHPEAGYEILDLPNGAEIRTLFQGCGRYASEAGIRLSFHPDQFVVLNSPNPATVAHSVEELEYQAEVAEWVGADTINVHGGGAYGDKGAALRSLQSAIERLPERIRTRLTLENDNIFTTSDLLPVCFATGVPLVYDVHHHRCLPDGLSVEAATEQARATWDREPLFHVSSPLEGWDGPKPERHHDYIAWEDFPRSWLGWPLTVDVEAKAKELAVARLRSALLEVPE
ncbi:MAG: UV DNA damage repair endonuclease UvsE [Fimbriimonadaceae bacterium]